jgi:hypothetical protein
MAKRKGKGHQRSSARASKPRRSTTTAQPPRSQGGFRLPPGVTSRKEPLANGTAYVFRHAELGLLGRLLLQDIAGANCQISLELAGDPDDPMTAKRAAIFKPLGMELANRLEQQLGNAGTAHGLTPPSPPPPSHELVESKMMQCARCDAGVALLIFADQATDLGGLEDYARKMYVQIRQLNVPTRVIGPPTGSDPLPERPADILKVWPEREPVQRMRPDEFNPIIDQLARAHCGDGSQDARDTKTQGHEPMANHPTPNWDLQEGTCDKRQ